MARITLDHLAHSYRPQPDGPAGLRAARRSTTSGAQGGAYALLGPSGCGKTTLLNIISGLVRPSRGRILFDERDVTDLPTEARNIAQVFQFPVVYDTMTVRENLAFPLKNRGVPRDAIAAARRGDRAPARPHARARPQGPQPHGRREAEDLARARPRAPGRGGDPVRRAAHRHRPAPEMAAALDPEGDPPRARPHHDLRDPRPDGGADLRRQGGGDARRRGGADRHAGRAVRAPGPHLRRPLHRLAGHERAAVPGRGRDGLSSTAQAIPLAARLSGAAGRASGSSSASGPNSRSCSRRGAGLPVRVRRIDDLGRARIARVELAGRPMAASVPESLSIDGDEAALVFDPRHVHIYADGHLVAGEPCARTRA